MKKYLIAVLMLVVALTGCGKTDGNETGVEGTVKSDITSATELLETTWNLYGDDDKFPIMGGDPEHGISDAPGAFDITKAEDADSFLAYPAAEIASIDDAASIMHMMNGNTFTCGVYHVTGNAKDVAQAIHTNIASRQWVCGSPEKELIATVDDVYVVAAFGASDLMDTFEKKLVEAYPNAVIETKEDITIGQ